MVWIVITDLNVESFVSDGLPLVKITLCFPGTMLGEAHHCLIIFGTLIWLDLFSGSYVVLLYVGLMMELN